MSYIVDFERIGRDHNVDSLKVDSDDPTEIAGAVFGHARKHLSSSWFDVTVDMGEMRGSIEAGRFGRFTLRKSPDV